MSKKIQLWENMSILEDQIQEVDVKKVKHVFERNKEQMKKQLKIGLYAWIVVAIIAHWKGGKLSFESIIETIGGAFFWGFGLAIVLLELLSRIFPKLKTETDVFRIEVIANIGGKTTTYESPEFWEKRSDAFPSAWRILAQMESDALRYKNSHYAPRTP